MKKGFLFIFFISQNTDEATFFKSEKDRWGRAWETIYFFFYLIEI